MAIVTKTIGTASRDYATITLWEADLDNAGVYNAGDDAVGECYNDSAFDDDLTMNGGATLGLASVHLTAASGQRHSGVANSGARNVRTGTKRWRLQPPAGLPYRLSWMEFDGSKLAASCVVTTGATFGASIQIDHMLVHSSSGGGDAALIEAGTRDVALMNCFMYGAVRTGSVLHACRVDADLASGRCSNNTIYGTDNQDVTTGTASGLIIASDNTNGKIQNNIVTGTKTGGSGAANDFDFVGAGMLTSSNNLSSDATAGLGGGLNHIINADPDQFVSIAQGSEDLHLAETSVAIDAGADLGITPAGINLDINNSNREAFTATVWDIGAHQYEIVASIGTASRDYSTITAWEAALGDTTIYGQGGGRARGDCYNDSAFQETFLLNAGPSAVVLQAAEGERHSGVAGTGARILGTTNQIGDIIEWSKTFTLRWMEIDGNGARGTGITNDGTNRTIYVDNCLIHSTGSAGNTQKGNNIRFSFSQGHLKNSIFYGANSSDEAINLACTISGSNTTSIYNCTVYGGNNGGANRHNLFFRNGTHNLTNVISVASPNNDYSFHNSGEVVNLANSIDSDGTAANASNPSNNISNVDPQMQFVSTIAGSEDLHLVEDSDAIGTGQALGDTEAVDINGSNRKAFTAQIWDIGAHQFELIASIGTASRDYSTITAWNAGLADSAIYGPGARARGECWNDSVFAENFTIDGSAPGMIHRTLSVESTQRHPGDPSSGAVVQSSATAAYHYRVAPNVRTTVEWLRFDCSQANATGSETGYFRSFDNTSFTTLQNCLFYGGASPGAGRDSRAVRLDKGECLNCQAFRIQGQSGRHNSGIESGGSQFRGVSILNCTAHNMSGGNNRGILVPGHTNQAVRNCIATDSGTCFSYANQDPSATNNLSSDTTASAAGGAGHIINAAAADEFVSVAVGSEDLHLKKGAQAIKAGVDLGDTPAGVNIDIDGADRDRFASNVWDIGADQYELAASIGVTARDYATITAWEADFDSTAIYGRQGARSVGKCYADGDFSERVLLDGGASVGMISQTLTVAAGQRHTGVAGTGAKIINDGAGSATSILDLRRPNSTVEWLEIDGNNNDWRAAISAYGGIWVAGTTCAIRQVIAHGAAGNTGMGIEIDSTAELLNTILYAISRNTSWTGYCGIEGPGSHPSAEVITCANVTVHSITTTSTHVAGVRATDKAEDSWRNVIVTDCLGGSTEAVCWAPATFANAVVSHNISSDATASGTGSLTNRQALNQFVSIAVGTEDLHIKAGADAQDTGLDLGSTPYRVNFDIDDQDRQVIAGPAWDMGADEIEASAEKPVNSAQHSHTASSPITFALVNDAQHGHTATTPNPGVEPDDTAHGHTAASPLGPQLVNGAQHGHTAQSPGLGGDPHDAQHGHQASQPVGGGVPQDAQHLHLVSQPWTGFSVNGALHGHLADSVPQVIDPDGALHGHEATSPNCVGVQNCTHGHQADIVYSILPTVTLSLVRHLTSDPNVAALFGENVHAEHVPDSPCPPYIWLSVRSVSWEQCMDDTGGPPDVENFDLEIWAEDLQQLKDVMIPSVRSSLHRLGIGTRSKYLGGMPVQVVNVADQSEDYLPRGNSGPPLFWSALDVEVVPR